ncbi:MAG: TatD family hydrolase [bacterium]
MFDTHTHLDDQSYDLDRKQVIEKIFAQGIKYFISVGCDLNSSKKAIDFTNENNNVFASCGIHPHNAKDVDIVTYQSLQELAQKNKVVAIGEIGLDYTKLYSPKPLQKKVFQEQLKIAKKLNLPVIIHSRDAYQDIIEILDEENYYNAVIHCFSGDKQIYEYCLEKKMYVSFAGYITYKNFSAKEIIKNLNMNYLLVETDCPYLTPHPFRGKRNDPTYLKYIIETIATIKKMSFQEVEEITTLNAKKIFNIL